MIHSLPLSAMTRRSSPWNLMVSIAFMRHRLGRRCGRRAHHGRRGPLTGSGRSFVPLRWAGLCVRHQLVMVEEHLAAIDAADDLALRPEVVQLAQTNRKLLCGFSSRIADTRLRVRNGRGSHCHAVLRVDWLVLMSGAPPG